MPASGEHEAAGLPGALEDSRNLMEMPHNGETKLQVAELRSGKPVAFQRFEQDSTAPSGRLHRRVRNRLSAVMITG